MAGDLEIITTACGTLTTVAAGASILLSGAIILIGAEASGVADTGEVVIGAVAMSTVYLETPLMVQDLTE
ncbi:hypothetical protein DBR11_09890, partial [Pedobacter sp. HMWF019]